MRALRSARVTSSDTSSRKAAVEASYAYGREHLMPRAPRTTPPSLIGTHSDEVGSWSTSGFGLRNIVRAGAAAMLRIEIHLEVGAESASRCHNRAVSARSLWMEAI